MYPRLLCTWRWSPSRRRRWRRCSWPARTPPWQIVTATRHSIWRPSRMEKGWSSFYCSTEWWELCWTRPTQQVHSRSYCSSQDPRPAPLVQPELKQPLEGVGKRIKLKSVFFCGYQVCVRSTCQFWPISCLLSGSCWRPGLTWRLRSAAVDEPCSTWPPRPKMCRWPAACCWRYRPVSESPVQLVPSKIWWCVIFLSSGKRQGGLLHLQWLHPPPHRCRQGLRQANSSADGCRYETSSKSFIY